MRLWHHELIGTISDKRLLGQHRECCALRGNGWGKKYSTVDYIKQHSYYTLYLYHMQVMEEMITRGFHVEPHWSSMDYRGKTLGYVNKYQLPNIDMKIEKTYPEHNDEYKKECLDLLVARDDFAQMRRRKNKTYQNSI